MPLYPVKREIQFFFVASQLYSQSDQGTSGSHSWCIVLDTPEAMEKTRKMTFETRSRSLSPTISLSFARRRTNAIARIEKVFLSVNSGAVAIEH